MLRSSLISLSLFLSARVLSKLEADAEDDLAAQMIAYRKSIELMHMHALARGGMVREATEMADKAIRNSTGPTQTHWRTQKYHMLLSARRDDDAAEVLISLTRESNASSLVQMAFAVHGFEDVSPKLIAAAITAAETAMKGKPDYIEASAVLARLVHKNGELDRAIDLQRLVVENAGRNSLAHLEFLKQMETERNELYIGRNQKSPK